MNPNKKTIIVTGGSRGIGLSTAELLLKKGFQVVLISDDATGLQRAKRELISSGNEASCIEIEALDLSDVQLIRSRVPSLCAARQSVDGLVNNAAIEILKPLTALTVADMEAMWRVNMLAPIAMIQACHPFLKKAEGSIINVGSISDSHFSKRYSLYGASKAFLNSFSGHAAKELGFDGVRINVVSPGPVDTPLMQSLIDDGTFSKEYIASAKEKIPVEQRFATKGEIAEAIHFALTGPRYFHGADIRIHGACV